MTDRFFLGRRHHARLRVRRHRPARTLTARRRRTTRLAATSTPWRARGRVPAGPARGIRHHRRRVLRCRLGLGPRAAPPTVAAATRSCTRTSRCASRRCLGLLGHADRAAAVQLLRAAVKEKYDKAQRFDLTVSTAVLRSRHARPRSCAACAGDLRPDARRRGRTPARAARHDLGPVQSPMPRHRLRALLRAESPSASGSLKELEAESADLAAENRAHRGRTDRGGEAADRASARPWRRSSSAPSPMPSTRRCSASAPAAGRQGTQPRPARRRGGRRRFLTAAQPVLAQLMRDAGAAVILERRDGLPARRRRHDRAAIQRMTNAIAACIDGPERPSCRPQRRVRAGMTRTAGDRTRP